MIESGSIWSLQGEDCLPTGLGFVDMQAPFYGRSKLSNISFLLSTGIRRRKIWRIDNTLAPASQFYSHNSPLTYIQKKKKKVIQSLSQALCLISIYNSWAGWELVLLSGNLNNYIWVSNSVFGIAQDLPTCICVFQMRIIQLAGKPTCKPGNMITAFKIVINLF